MRSTISFSVKPQEAVKTRNLARARGFESVSGYIRFLLALDEEDLISEDEILRRSHEADKLKKSGGLIQAKSIAELM